MFLMLLAIFKLLLKTNEQEVVNLGQTTKKNNLKNSKNRISYNTTLKPELIEKANKIKAHLLINGVKKDGVNELIEEGLKVVIKKYKDKLEIDEI